jgi:death-on-curing protein
VNPRFLSVDVVIEAHSRHVRRFGGTPGVRDQHLLESTLAQPMATFGGTYLHPDLLAMAAAYHFHMVKNHPFIDGNRRAGLAVLLSFLEVNGIVIDRPLPVLLDATMGIEEGTLDKHGLAELLRRLTRR